MFYGLQIAFMSWRRISLTTKYPLTMTTKPSKDYVPSWNICYKWSKKVSLSASVLVIEVFCIGHHFVCHFICIIATRYLYSDSTSPHGDESPQEWLISKKLMLLTTLNLIECSFQSRPAFSEPRRTIGTISATVCKVWRVSMKASSMSSPLQR